MSGFYGVIGDPIAHSLSPLIHNGWIRDHGLETSYTAFQVPDGELKGALDTFAHRGAKGLNVTMPHKLSALALSETATPRASQIRAANTLWRAGDGNWHADNTDAPGFLVALLPHLDRPVRGQKVLIIGAGGAARAVVYALAEEGAVITLANRTLSRAESLLADFPTVSAKPAPLEEALSRAAGFDFVVNTTSLGHQGQSLALPPGEGRLLYDLSYGKAADQTLKPAAEQGWSTQDGLSMLVYQAAFAFERWFGIMPDADKGLARCRAVLEMA